MLAALSLLYAPTAARYVLGEDNGEFCAVFAAGGVAHPSGYPLYTLILRAFSWLPAHTPAEGAARVTAALGLAAAVALFAACRAWGAGTAASALAAVTYGTAPLAWDLATKAEVFALNAAIGATIVLVAAPEGPLRGVRRAATLGLLLGLGLSNHHTVVLLAPLVVWSTFRACSEASRRGAVLAGFALGICVGLLPYASLPFEARAGGDAWVWGDVTTVPGIVHHFLRRDFGTARLSPGSEPPALLGGVARSFATLFIELRGVGAVTGVVVLVLGVVRRRSGIIALLLSFLLAGPGFAALTNVEGTPEGAAIVRRFCLLPALLLCVPFALGADVALRRLRPALQALIVAVALIGGAVVGFGDVAADHGPMLEAYVTDMLRTAAPRAVVLGSGDARVFGTLYAQVALGLRRDVVFVTPIMLHFDWYRARIERELGFSLPPPSAGSISTVALAARILGSGRRLFLAEPENGFIVRSFATYPLGTLIEVLPKGAFPPSPAELEAQNLAVFERYHLDARLTDVARPWTRGPREAYARPWAALAEAYRAANDEAGARRNERRAATLEPWILR